MLARWQLQKAARSAGLSAYFLDGRGAELQRSFEAIARERYDGMFVGATGHGRSHPEVHHRARRRGD